jgi:hypothetical protein
MNYIDYTFGLSMTAGHTVCYHPALRPLIKFLEETNPNAFRNFATPDVCMLTWLTDCKVQIVPECIYLWSNGIHESFASRRTARCYDTTHIIPDIYELNQHVIAAVKRHLSLSESLIIRMASWSHR